MRPGLGPRMRGPTGRCMHRPEQHLQRNLQSPAGLSVTVLSRMGKRWARWAVLGTLVVLPPIPLISPAQGSSGGAGTAPKAKHKHAHKA